MRNPGCENCDKIASSVLYLNPSQLEILNSTCSAVSVKANEMIMSEGSLTSHIIYLRSGLVKEFQKTESGNSEYIIKLINQQAYLGLHSLFGDRLNHFSYKALTDVDICFFDREVFKKLLYEKGEFSYKILETVSRDSLNTYHRFVNQHQKKIYGKVADALLYFSKKIYQSNSFHLHLSRNEISYLVGISRESVSKHLKQFEEEGIVSFKGREMEVLKPNELERISRFG